MLVNIISKYHTSTKRDYLARMDLDKPMCMVIAKKYDSDYWDGERRFGYGGYNYDGRWKPIAKALIKKYSLNKHSKILDIGCGKGHLAYEIQELVRCKVYGCDISRYALENCKIKNTFLFNIGKKAKLPFVDKFDLILCVNVLHNLRVDELKIAFKTIRDSSHNSYIVMDSYTNDLELFNLQCWALTCESFFRPEEWEFLFKEWGYSGDYEFIYYQ